MTIQVALAVVDGFPALVEAGTGEPLVFGGPHSVQVQFLAGVQGVRLVMEQVPLLKEIENGGDT